TADIDTAWMPSLSASSIAASTIFSTLISRLGPRCGVAATPHARAIPLGSCSIGSSVLISPSYIVYVIYCVLLSYTVFDTHICLHEDSARRGAAMPDRDIPGRASVGTDPTPISRHARSPSADEA